MPSVDEIKTVCDKCGVKAELTKFMTESQPGGLGLESLSDFANYFTEVDNRYEVELQAKVLDVAQKGAYKDDTLALSRLRTA